MGFNSAAESRFGILIEGRNESKGAFDEATRSNRELIATVERLISIPSSRRARPTTSMTRSPAPRKESKRLREEQTRLAEEQDKAAEASRKAAADARQLAEAQKAARENAIEWAASVAAVGALLVTSSNRAGDFQERVELISEGTGFAARSVRRRSWSEPRT